MKRPLYKDNAAPDKRPAAAHTGLWFDKFCNQWCRDTKKTGLAGWSLKAFAEGEGKSRRDINPKLDWIRTVTGSTVGDPKLLAEHTTRLADLARTLGGQSLVFKSTSRFATGLGREHPIENGFVWHPALGVPYLPGSSVKGLVRAWATTWAEPEPKSEDRGRILGGPGAVGTVLFLEALPLGPVQLKADVMTPHYGDYYEGKKDQGNLTPAADWLSPNPIPFLTVAPGQTFQFALAPRTLSAQDRKDCDACVKWLEEALTWLGAGAKTAVGYGRFAKAEATASAEQPAISSQATIARPAGPRYKPGQRVTVRRVEDPKGKGRVWFQADDGFGGVVPGGAPPQIEIGQTSELEIASVTQGTGYNFRLPHTSPPQASRFQTPPRRR